MLGGGGGGKNTTLLRSVSADVIALMYAVMIYSRTCFSVMRNWSYSLLFVRFAALFVFRAGMEHRSHTCTTSGG